MLFLKKTGFCVTALVSVEELVSVKDVSSAPLRGGKIHILMLLVLG